MKTDATTQDYCHCGCGGIVTGRGGRYIRYHNSRGVKHGPVWLERQSVGLKRAWAEGKMDSVRGLKRSAETCARISAMNKLGREAGKYAVFQKGRADHPAASFWVLRDPKGRIHRFSNLSEWARQNEGLFIDANPESKLPFALRIKFGIANLHSGTRPNTHYKGWVVVSGNERMTGAPDLLGRDAAEIPVGTRTGDWEPEKKGGAR